MDVFGRERFDEHRQDHGGVGSMRSDSKTLYVGRIHIDHAMEATVQKHFQQWGEIERVKILREKGVAFVTYQSRLNAEFAKEAMASQSLDHGEVKTLFRSLLSFAYRLQQHSFTDIRLAVGIGHQYPLGNRGPEPKGASNEQTESG